MQTDLAWQYNAYQAGNIFEVLAYADVAADLEKKNLTLPNLGAVSWKSSEMWQLGINQLNYMLGVNPWDISFVYGVGDKNDAHPHHRASNPEGRNMENTKDYKYRSVVWRNGPPSQECYHTAKYKCRRLPHFRSMPCGFCNTDGRNNHSIKPC